MSTTSHAMSTSISEQSSHTSINNIVQSVVMETPTRPQTDDAMPSKQNSTQNYNLVMQSFHVEVLM